MSSSSEASLDVQCRENHDFMLARDSTSLSPRERSTYCACRSLSIIGVRIVDGAPSLPIPRTISRMRSARSLGRTPPRSTGLITCTLWKSTRTAQSRRWWRTVRGALSCLHDAPSDIFRTADNNGMMGSMMQDLAYSIPGVDEAMGFAEVMKCVECGLAPLCTC